MVSRDWYDSVEIMNWETVIFSNRFGILYGDGGNLLPWTGIKTYGPLIRRVIMKKHLEKSFESPSGK